ncbi:MAG: nucleotidyltransferase family protein [Armatimonadota bacterium]
MLSIQYISENIKDIADEYSVKQMSLFGSYANGTANEDSDVDFLVEFSTSVPTLFDIYGLQEEIARRLHISVDVIALPLAKPVSFHVGRSIVVYERAGNV